MPTGERGVVGGVLAIAQTLGVIAGVGHRGGHRQHRRRLPHHRAACSSCTTLPYALDSRDIPLPRELRPPFRWRPFLRGFWVSPRQHPDFGWAWITRFLMNLGNALLVLYLLYYLKDAVAPARRRGRGRACSCSPPSTALVTVVTAFVGGLWSDRLGRRKVFVIWSGLIAAAALLLFALRADHAGRLRRRASCSASASAPTRRSTSR